MQISSTIFFLSASLWLHTSTYILGFSGLLDMDVNSSLDSCQAFISLMHTLNCTSCYNVLESLFDPKKTSNLESKKKVKNFIIALHKSKLCMFQKRTRLVTLASLDRQPRSHWIRGP